MHVEIDLEVPSLDVACARAAQEAFEKYDGWEHDEVRRVSALRHVATRAERREAWTARACWIWTYTFEVDVE